MPGCARATTLALAATLAATAGCRGPARGDALATLADPDHALRPEAVARAGGRVLVTTRAVGDDPAGGTARALWTAAPGGAVLARAAAPVPAGPLVVAGDVAYVWGRDGQVVALDPDGAPRDVARTRAGAIAVAVDGDDLVGAIDDVTRPLTRVDRGGGAPVDVTASVALPTDDRLTELAALRGVVYGALDDQLVAIAGDGAVTRVVDESARPRCVLAAAGQLVYVHAGLTATELVVLQPGGAPTAVRALRRGDAPVCAATADHAYVAADGVIVRVGPGPRATVVVHTGEVAALAADAAGVVWVERAARGWEVRRAGP